MLRKIKYKITKIKRGFSSLVYWLPVIWKNNWWDYGYLLGLIEHQLKLMSRDSNKSYSVEWDECREEMKYSLLLLDKFNNEEDWNMEQEWFDEFIDSLKVMRKWWD